MKNPFKKNVEVTYTEVDTNSTLDSQGQATRPGDRNSRRFVAKDVPAAKSELGRRSRGGDKEIVNPTARKTRKTK